MLAYELVGLCCSRCHGMVVLVGFDVFASRAEIEQVRDNSEGKQNDAPKARLTAHSHTTDTNEVSSQEAETS